MALKVKAREKLQKIGAFAGEYRYVMMPELYTPLSQEKVIKEAALRSGVTEGVMQACWDGAGKVIKAWATAIQITCYDRNGEEVKRVTSSDPGTVEDPDSSTPSTGSGTVDEGSGSGSSAGSETVENGSGTVNNGSGIIPTPTDPEDDQPA